MLIYICTGIFWVSNVSRPSFSTPGVWPHWPVAHRVLPCCSGNEGFSHRNKKRREKKSEMIHFWSLCNFAADYHGWTFFFRSFLMDSELNCLANKQRKWMIRPNDISLMQFHRCQNDIMIKHKIVPVCMYQDESLVWKGILSSFEFTDYADIKNCLKSCSAALGQLRSLPYAHMPLEVTCLHDLVFNQYMATCC